MKNLLLTALAIASTGMLYAQSSWELENETVSYNLGAGTGIDPKTRVLSGAAALISTTIESQYLPCPTDGTVRVATNSAGGTFVLDDDNKSLTFTAANSTSYTTNFSMYDVQNASPLTKLSFSISFKDNTSPISWWNLALGQKQMESDSVFTGVNFLANVPAYYEVFNAFRWVVNNTTEGDKTISFLYRDKNNTTAAHNYRTVSSTLFEQGKMYNIEIICNNTDQTQRFILGGQIIGINSRRTMFVVNGEIADIPNLSNAASDDQIFSKVMPVNTAINSFIFSGYKGTNTGNTGNSDSEITLSNISWNYVKPAALPVSFISFTGKNTSEGVQLTWETASEENNSYFEIYRSQDGQTFSRINSVPGSLNTNQRSNYSFIDKYPLKGANYYQLKQVDNDGKSSTYDKIVFVASSFGNEEFNVFISPEKQININVSSDKDESVSVQLTDITGRTVYKANKYLSQSGNHIRLPYMALTPGIYMINIVYENNKIKTAKIIL